MRKLKKLNQSLLLGSSVALEWSQPTYFDALQMSRNRNDNWAFPVGVRASALWSLCPALPLPAGATSLSCDQSTCMTVCQPGYKAFGRRRIRCRWKRKKGFFWKQQLGDCSTCDPSAPPSDITSTCEINSNNNRKICDLTCPSGQQFR